MVEQIRTDYRNASISSADRAMLDYAVRLTEAPWEIEERDVTHLQQQRFSDSAILDINQVTGYFNFVNRLADGLGVKLEPYWQEPD